MYKIIRSILIIAATMLCTAVLVSANSEYSISGFMITKYNGNADVVTVPAVIDGIEIAGIDTNAFVNKDMHTVIIEDGIEVIQPKAFVGCDNLEYVKSPESMLLINENAFFECFSLSKLDVSKNTYVMTDEPLCLLSETESESHNGFLYSDNTITGYNGEDTEITIPNSINDVTITTIAASAFAGNTTLTSVTIPDTITTIGDSAFKGCTALEEVSLSKTLSAAGTGVFSGCTALKSVTVPGSLKKLADNMFYGCSALTDVILEEGVERTGNYAFYNCHLLKSISVPSTLKGIDVWSFGYCYALESFYIPEGVTYISTAAFYLCWTLDSIVMPDTITSIESHAFRGCSGITSMKLSGNLERIPYRALNGCGFSKITIPQKVIYIDDESFYQCQKLTSIHIPDNVISIGNYAFYGCYTMTEGIIYGEGVVFGTDVFLGVYSGCKIWLPENSATSKSAEAKGVAYYPIQDCASVSKQQLYINDSLVSLGEETNIKAGDEIYVKYRAITANDTKNSDILFAFILFDSEGTFMEIKPVPVEMSANSEKYIEHSMEVADEAYVKVILLNSLSKMKPLCAAIEVCTE